MDEGICLNMPELGHYPLVHYTYLASVQWHGWAPNQNHQTRFDGHGYYKHTKLGLIVTHDIFWVSMWHSNQHKIFTFYCVSKMFTKLTIDNNLNRLHIVFYESIGPKVMARHMVQKMQLIIEVHRSLFKNVKHVQKK